MAVVEPVESDTLSTFDRLLPKEIEVYPEMRYKDVNDVEDHIRLSTKKCLRTHPAWRQIHEDIKDCELPNLQISRRYCVYGWHNDSLIGRVVFTEFLDHPEGYGKSSFRHAKFVFPEYFGSTWSRALMGDWIYALFMSNIADYLYGYVRINPNSEESFVIKQIDKSWPCVGKIFRSDNSDFIPYITFKRKFVCNGKHFALMEMNGFVFRSMNIYKYLRIDKRPPDVVFKTKAAMDTLAKVIQTYQESTQHGRSSN